MKIKNYEWNGFGFPIIFDELPAIKVRGEWIPDVDFAIYAEEIAVLMCTKQLSPFTGNQVKFLRHHFGMSLREFAGFMGVTHQSVMRWEDRKKKPAKMGPHIEATMKFKVLKRLDEAEMLSEVDLNLNNHAKHGEPLRIRESARHFLR